MKNWLEEGKQDEKVLKKNLIPIPSEEAITAFRGNNNKVVQLRLEYGLDREGLENSSQVNPFQTLHLAKKRISRYREWYFLHIIDDTL